jgi:hypothetical protein
MFREVMLDIWLKFTDVLEESTDLVFKHFAWCFLVCLLAQITLRSWRWWKFVPPKHWWMPTRPHGVASQNIVVYVLTAQISHLLLYIKLLLSLIML